MYKYDHSQLVIKLQLTKPFIHFITIHAHIIVYLTHTSYVLSSNPHYVYNDKI